MHRRIIPVAFPGDIVPKTTFAGERSSPLLANAPLFNIVPKAAFAKSPPCLKGGRGDSVSLPRRHCAEDDVFRTPREGRPYGQTDKPHTVGRGLAPAETFGDSLQAERLTKSRRGELRSPVLPCHPGCLSRRHRADGNVCGRSQNAPTCQCVIVRHRAKGSLRKKPPLPGEG